MHGNELRLFGAKAFTLLFKYRAPDIAAEENIFNVFGCDGLKPRFEPITSSTTSGCATC